jgi:hypothetical protein
MLDGETVSNVLIGKHSPSQIAHDLMHLDQDLPNILWVKGNRLDVSINLTPLLCPVSIPVLAKINYRLCGVFSHIQPEECVSAIVLQRFRNCTLLDKGKDPTKRLWYIQQTIEYGWSRHNFSRTLGR